MQKLKNSQICALVLVLTLFLSFFFPDKVYAQMSSKEINVYNNIMNMSGRIEEAIAMQEGFYLESRSQDKLDSYRNLQNTGFYGALYSGKYTVLIGKIEKCYSYQYASYVYNSCSIDSLMEYCVDEVSDTAFVNVLKRGYYYSQLASRTGRNDNVFYDAIIQSSKIEKTENNIDSTAVDAQLNGIWEFVKNAITIAIAFGVLYCVVQLVLLLFKYTIYTVPLIRQRIIDSILEVLIRLVLLGSFWMVYGLLLSIAFG